MTWGTSGPELGSASVQLQSWLRPGERLLWAGQPDPNVVFAPGDGFLVPFSIFWSGFAVFWTAGAALSGVPPFFVVAGVPFVVIGLYMAFGRFTYKRWLKNRTVYGVTDRRAIVVVRGRSVQHVPLDTVPVSTRHSRNGSHVSVTFGDILNSNALENTGLDIGTGTRPIAFHDVDDQRALLDALDTATDNRRRP